MRVLSLAGVIPPQQRSQADVAQAIINKYGTPAFLLGDQNPALRMPSGLRRGYQNFINTPVTAATQTVALAPDLSEGAAIGAELGDGSALDKRAATDGTVTRDAGIINFENAAAGLSTAISEEITGLTVGKLYRFGGRLRKVSGDNPVMALRSASGGGGSALATGASVAETTFIDRVVYWVATQTSVHASYLAGNSSVFEVVEASHSFKEIAGNHFVQLNSADEPTLNVTNGLYGVLGDGASKHFRTGLVPASSMTYMAAFTASAATDAIVGSLTGSSDRSYLAIDGSGRLSAGVGTDAITDIFGGSSIIGVPGIGALTYDGAAVTLEWMPIGGALSTLYQDSQNGTPNTTIPINALAFNNNGSPGLYFDGAVFRILAQRSAYTAADRLAIANQWSRELAALAA